MELAGFVSTWGSTEQERAASYPCDSYIGDPDLTAWRAVDVDAPAATVFRWLCQLRAAPYSYDWIDNWGRRSPQQLTPGLEDLAVGQPAMTIFRIVDFEPGESLTFRYEGPLFGRVAITYRVVPTGQGTCRLVVKLLGDMPRDPVGIFMRAFLPAGDLVMMRRQLLNLKALAEAHGAGAREPSIYGDPDKSTL